MRLTFIGKDPLSNPTGSPTVYRTDRGTLVVQGWQLTDPDARARMNIPDGEDAVEIPDRMLQYFLLVILQIVLASTDQEGRDHEFRGTGFTGGPPGASPRPGTAGVAAWTGCAV